MSWRGGAVALFLIACAVAAPAAAQPAPPAPGARAEVPIREVVLSDGMRRYTIPIRMGAVEIEAGLDTGSTGLRILPGVLGPADATAGSRGETYAYGSGAKYEGVAGEGRLGIGGLSGLSPVQLIRSLGCVDRVPRCPVSRVPAEQYGIQGDGLPNEGFKAIVGTNMAHARIANPLVALGVRRWIVELPRPGEGAPGRLILNPTEAEAAGYAVLPVATAFAGQQGGLHDAVAGCILNNASQAKFCGALLMDTGAPGISVVNGGLGHAPWPSGTQATLAFFDGAGHLQAAEAFTVGLRSHASAFGFRQEPREQAVAIYAGLNPYFAFSVLYDAERQTVGLKPRTPTADGPRAIPVPAP